MVAIASVTLSKPSFVSAAVWASRINALEVASADGVAEAVFADRARPLVSEDRRIGSMKVLVFAHAPNLVVN